MGAIMKATIDEKNDANDCEFPSLPRVRRQVREDRIAAWARTSATMGAAVWAGLALLARMGIARIGEIELLFLFAPLVIVPLGMELSRHVGGDGWALEWAQRIQPPAAVFAVAGILLPQGRRAGVVATGWLVLCALMAADGMMRIVGLALDRNIRAMRSGSWLVDFALAVARVDLAVGGLWLVASRLGMHPMGIQEPIGLLTAVHFHFAGFATATIAAATVNFAESRGTQRWLRAVVLTVVGLPFFVAAGFVISPAVKMVTAGLFSLSVAVLAVFLRGCVKQVKDPTARVVLQIASGAVFAAMLFAGAYVVADFVGSDAVTIPLMARTHGVLNAVGFCLPGLLGWLVENSTR
jgi:hypothetical protein